MEYRKIGKTNKSAGVIGLGCEHLDGKPYETVEEVIHTALDNKINLLDVFMPGEEVRKNIGKALGARRKDVMLQGHICSVDTHQQYDISRDLDVSKRYFENLLTALNTDYIDFGMLFYIDSEEAFQEVFESDIIKYAQDLKRQGVVGALGASSHNPVIARKVVETGLIDLLMFSINPAFDMVPASFDALEHLGDDFAGFNASRMDPEREKLYQVCAREEVSISVMKSLGAGKLLTAEHSPFGKPLSTHQCLHYALSRPAVVSALVGAANKQQLLDALQYLNTSEADRDYASVIGQYQSSFDGSCVYCNHCLPCPANIDVAAVHRLLDTALLDTANIPQNVRSEYANLTAHGKDCIACGKCEKKCPFSVPVIKDMEKAATVFGV